MRTEPASQLLLQALTLLTKLFDFGLCVGIHRHLPQVGDPGETGTRFKFETREEFVVRREAFALRANNVKSSAHTAETGAKVSSH